MKAAHTELNVINFFARRYKIDHNEFVQKKNFIQFTFPDLVAYFHICLFVTTPLTRLRELR
jgi:hypothetical protein